MQVTPWNQCIDFDDRTVAAGELDLRDIARGFAGALFVSLPLLFTMEMWQIAKTIPDAVLLAFLGISFLLNRLYIQFAGFRREAWQCNKWWDAVVVMGIGAIASTITLFVAGIISLDLDWYLSFKTIALETIPTSLGAAVAINQLGSGDSSKPEKIGLSPDTVVIVGTFLGGFLFAFNIGPTLETKVIVLKQAWWQIGLTFVLSVAISYMIVAVAQFETRDMSQRKYITSEWLEALVSYIVAFLLSMLLLWVFGYGTPLDPLEVWLPQTVALAYATTLGGAAGRLIL